MWCAAQGVIVPGCGGGDAGAAGGGGPPSSALRTGPSSALRTGFEKRVRANGGRAGARITASAGMRAAWLRQVVLAMDL